MLSIENFRKRYDDFELDCTMSVEPGQITGIVGANGAGKSTLFKAILGLVKGDSGRITLFGKEPQQLTREDKEKIGVAFTNAGFNEYLRIKDIVPVLSNVYPSFEKEKFLGSCKKLNLPLDKKLKEFSTGMKAKLNVLIAVSHQAPFLILDEPTAGLDVTAREQVLDLLREYMTEVDGSSIAISSHISSDLEGLCDDIYMIHEGKIILHETMDTILNDYGVIKVTEEQWKKLDKSYLLKKKKESYYDADQSGKKFGKWNFIMLAVIIVIEAVLYYVLTPTINLHSVEFWIWMIVTVVALFICTLNLKAEQMDDMPVSPKLTKIFGIVIGIMILAALVGWIGSSKLFAASKYAGLIQIEDGNFETDIVESKEINDIALMDTDTAVIIGERAIGSLSDVVSQYEVSSDYSTIDYNGSPMKVAALEYAGFIKYMNNKKSGIPGYVLVDPVKNEAKYVKLEKPMIYSPSAYFNQNLYRHVQMAYPTACLLYTSPSPRDCS